MRAQRQAARVHTPAEINYNFCDLSNQMLSPWTDELHLVTAPLPTSGGRGTGFVDTPT